MSKLRTVLGVAILMIVSAAVSTIAVSKWNLFPPKDYEDCAARAAKDAKSKDGLSLLLSICSADFEGRRKPGGGYVYQDSCQHRSFDIKGPNRTPDELKYMKTQCLAYLDAQAEAAAEEAESERKAQQAAQEAKERREQAERQAAARYWQAVEESKRAMQVKKISAMERVHVALTGFECPGESECTDSTRVTDGRFYYPNISQSVYMRLAATNGSNEAVSSITIGLASVPRKDVACPSAYAEKHTLYINLSPGETREKKIMDVDPAFRRNRVCIKVIDVKLAGN